MPDKLPPALRSASETRSRIVLVAQSLFSQKGYTETGLRQIADSARVSPTLVIKYFGSKSGLFEEALLSAITPVQSFQDDRSKFGKSIMHSIVDPNAAMSASAMIALSLGHAESRKVAAQVVLQHIIEPMADWLGSDFSHAQALNIFMYTTGFSVFSRNLVLEQSDRVQSDTSHIFAHILQMIVDFACHPNIQAH